MTDFTSEVAEVALAHINKDKTEAAYQRGDLFDKRRTLMAAWTEYCLSTDNDSKIVQLHKRSYHKSLN